MAVVMKMPQELVRIAESIDPDLRREEWCFRIGGMIRMRSIELNVLPEDIVENAQITLKELEDQEEGRKCLEAKKLERVVHFLKIDSIETFLRQALNRIPADWNARQDVVASILGE